MKGKKVLSKSQKRKRFRMAVFMTRLMTLFVIVAIGTTAYKFWMSGTKKNYVESDAYVDTNGISTMVSGVQNGAVYQSAVTPVITVDNVEKVTLTKDGEEIRFKRGKKIKKMGSYILSVNDKNGNTDTIYFDIEY